MLVEPDGLGFWFTGPERRTAHQRAVLAGNTDVADLLLAAGAQPATFDAVQQFVSACLSVDRHRIDELVAADPTVVHQAIAG